MFYDAELLVLLVYSYYFKANELLRRIFLKDNFRAPQEKARFPMLECKLSALSLAEGPCPALP